MNGLRRSWKVEGKKARMKIVRKRRVLRRLVSGMVGIFFVSWMGRVLSDVNGGEFGRGRTYGLPKKARLHSG
jgi:hypothetical protein